MNTNNSSKTASLDALIMNIFGNTDAVPQFAIKCDAAIMAKLRTYTEKIVSEHDSKISSIVENNAAELIDQVYNANIIYFKKGMQAGAGLLLQLLEL